MKDNNVYVKLDNGRYKAMGYQYPNQEYLPDGIYYVRHSKYGRSTTNVPYLYGIFRLGDSIKVDMSTVCGLEDICDEIMASKEWRELIDSGYSLNDLVHTCVAYLYKKSQEEKNV